MSFESWQQLRPENPPWMLGKSTGALVGGLGKVKDQLLARLRAGILARFPDATLAADDALGYKGSERVLDRFSGEASADYALRLQQAWETWALAASHGALLRQLEIQSFSPAHIVQDNGLWTTIGKSPADFQVRLVLDAGMPWAYDGTHLTAPSNGANVSDGFTINLNDRVLQWTRSAPQVLDGVYECTQAGDSTHPTILTRAPGWTTGHTISGGTAVKVTAGTNFTNNQFESLGTITVSTDAPRFLHGLLSNGIIFGDENTHILRGMPGWMFDTRNDLWSRFAIVFPGPGIVAALFGDAGQRRMSAIVDRWKPAYSAYVGSVQITSGEAWGWPPDRKWGSWTWGGSSVFLPP